MARRSPFSYDVFLSFRGEDTRRGFTGNLYVALKQRGIHCFFDDEEIRKGEEITPALVQAIEESRIAIVVLSKNYAFSSFCLKELTTILQCFEEKKNGRLVFPVFYDVDPSDVRNCRGSFGEALALQENKFKDNMEKVNKWRMALYHASNFAGFHFKLGDGYGYEYQFIWDIIKEVSPKINRTLLHVAKYPVGLESRMNDVISLLKVGSDDVVYMVGIYGIGGIGKSTITRAVYNTISDHFEGLCCFLEDVRGNSGKYDLVHLQETVLTKILGDKDIKLESVWNGMSKIEEKLCTKKVLLVLDDVDQIEQLGAIVGAPKWFGLGSRVIITTRDLGLLTDHKVDRPYKVEELNDRESRELLSWNAFKTDNVDTMYNEILNRAVGYASRLPLALELIGSNLSGKGVEMCKLILDKYNRIPPKEINDVLKVSYSSLGEEEKTIFLDIACCFGGYRLSDVETILHAHHGSSMKLSIELLVEKSLIKIDNGLVTLHRLIRDMGRNIAQQDSPEPNKRSRLWSYEDVLQVLQENKGTSKIHFLILDFPKDEAHLKGPQGEEVNWDGEALRKMKSLRTLVIRNSRFSKGPAHLPNSLRVLKWQGYPSPSLPRYFDPKKLTILELCDSYLNPCEPMQAFIQLRILDFSSSECITEIPDISAVRNLEKLSFKDCRNLTKIHDSVGHLQKLKILDASGCKNLETFPPILLTSLEQFNLSHCSILEGFPEILGKMEKVTELCITGTPIKEYPFSIEYLTGLRKLELQQICGVVQLPNSIFKLPELSLMHVSVCTGLGLFGQAEGHEIVSKSSNVDYLILSDCNISDDFLQIGSTIFSNVKDLNLSGNSFTTLQAWIQECRFLRNLKLDDCKCLNEIRGIPRTLETLSVKRCRSLRLIDLRVPPFCTAEYCFLKELILDDCVYLREIVGLPPNLDIFSAQNCTSLTFQSISMPLNQEWVEAGNKMYFFPGKKFPEWFSHHTRGESMSFWFRNKFPSFSLCLVIGLLDKKSIKVKFSPRVLINRNKQSLGYQKIYEFMIETDHVFFLEFEDNVDLVFTADEWNQVEVLYVDHITSNGVSIRQVASHSGIRVNESDLGDVRFDPPETIINVNLYLNSMEGPQQRLKIMTKRPQKDQTLVLSSPIPMATQPPPPDVKNGLPPQPILQINRLLEDVQGESSIMTKRPQKDQTMVLSSPIPMATQPPPSVVKNGLPSQLILQINRPLEDVHGERSIMTKRPQKDQTMVLSSPIPMATQPPPSDVKNALPSQPILQINRPLEDVQGESSVSAREDEVYAIQIHSHPVIERCREDDNVQMESVSSCELQSEESSPNSKGSHDSDDPFTCVVKKLSAYCQESISPLAKSEESSSNTKGLQSYGAIDWVDRKSYVTVSGQETISSGPSSRDVSLKSLCEAINALELLMAKDLSEVSSDPGTQSEFHQLLDLLIRRMAEAQEAIGEFKRKAFASFQEFQSGLESVNKLKNLKIDQDRIQQETVKRQGQQEDLKNSIQKVSLDINAEYRKKEELEAEIATLKKLLDTKERDLKQIVLNLKEQEASLATYSASCVSLNNQAGKLLNEVDDLLATSSRIKDEGEAAEAKQNKLKSTWSTDLTLQLNKIKNIFGLYD